MVPCDAIYFYQICKRSFAEKRERTNCCFIISVPLEPGRDRADYDDHMKLIRPIMRKHRRRYVVRSEGIEYIGKDWRPDRFVVIWFPDRESIDRCFSSERCRRIMSKGGNTVDSQAVIITTGEIYEDNRDKREGKME